MFVSLYYQRMARFEPRTPSASCIYAYQLNSSTTTKIITSVTEGDFNLRPGTCECFFQTANDEPIFGSSSFSAPQFFGPSGENLKHFFHLQFECWPTFPPRDTSLFRRHLLKQFSSRAPTCCWSKRYPREGPY